MRKYKRISTADMIDMSINAVLPRTIMTATTVFLALLALVFFGGEVIKSFSLAMMWGIFVGTYSSVFICSPILIYLGVRTENREAASGAPSSSAVAAKGKATA
jgi:preprotein translocase subunit SecF